MSMGRPLFQLRKEVDGAEAAAEKETGVDHSSLVNESHASEYITSMMDGSVNGQNTVSAYNNAKVLTENEKYVVRKLSPELSMLTSGNNNNLFEGLVDTHSGKALINDTDNLYIWDYQSCQKETDFCKIPLHEEYAVINTPPKCLFTWPPAMDDSTQMFLDGTSGSSGGVCIIQRKNSQLIYFEDIDSVNNLNSQLSKSKANILDLKLKDDETVVNAINCEPAGIIIATSFGRLLFITLRDSTGRLKVQLKQQLIKSQKGFLFHVFKSSKEIVSLKMGSIVGRGERLLHVVTRGGDFQTWNLSLSVSCYKRVEVNIFDQILDSLQGLYPFAHGTLQIIDSHPLFADLSSSHLVLSSISNERDTYYILSTIILDEKTNSFTIFSTYRLNTYVAPFDSYKPKLFIPDALGEKTKPITTVFVLFADAITLTQVSSNLDSSFPLRRKWEDIICLRENIRIIGSGYNADSLFVMTNKMGVLEVTINDNFSNEQDDLRFVKSHIDQAIYFSDVTATPIEFNLPKEISLESAEIEYDLLLSSNEIFFTKGKYIPPMLSTLTQHLNFRTELYRNLLRFIVTNFNYKISHYAKLEVLEKFEILNCCLQFTTFLQKSDKLTEIWTRIVSRYSPNMTTELLMVNHIDKFPQLFTQFLVDITKKDFASKSMDFKSHLVALVVSCLYDATLEDGEKTIRYQEFKLDPRELNKTLPWFINADILTAINDLFFDYKFSLISISDEMTAQLLSLTKILYYSFNQTNLWFSEDALREDSTHYQVIRGLFQENHLGWNIALCELSLQEACLQIAEFYKDFEGLIVVLETLQRDVSQVLYQQYFDQFGYEFAATVFVYYIKQEKIKDLFYRFPDQHDLLVRFFRDSEEYGSVAWIQEIMDNEFGKAAQTLSSISIGEKAKNQSLKERQLHLSIAKLSSLVEDSNDMNNESVNGIQSELDLIDAQQDLACKLEQGTVNMSSRYENTELRKVFEALVNRLEMGKSLTIDSITEIYTMLNDTEGFYNALKLLALSSANLDFETRTLLIARVWRRCILSEGDWSQISDLTTTALYQVLYRFFDEALYFTHCPLPSYGLITNEDFLNEKFLMASYKSLTDELYSIKNALEEELHAVKNLGRSFETRIQSILGSANEATGKRCTINYDTNTIEF